MSHPDSIPKLAKDGSNIFHWEQAFSLYAQSQNFLRLLTDSWEEPEVVKGNIQLEPTTITADGFKTGAELKAAQLAVREHNRLATEQYTEDLQSRTQWLAASGALKLVILNTLPHNMYLTVSRLTVLEQFEAIKARYREQGVTEECTMWVDFFKLRANECTTTQVFIDKYSSGLARLRNIPNVGLTDKQAIYQFIGAIEVAYPEYARQHRADLRAGSMPVLQSMCNELADEARRSDPVKAAYVTITRQKSGDGGNQNNYNQRGGRSSQRTGRGSNRGGGSYSSPSDRGRRSGLNCSRGGYGAANATATATWCEYCECSHMRGTVNCWYTFPEYAPDGWRAQNAAKINTANQHKKINAAAFQQPQQQQQQGGHNGSYDYGLNFSARSAFATRLVNLSAQVSSLASKDEFRTRLILDTGATDHLCNDASKFISIDPGSYHAVINTGAGPITVSQKGTINVDIMRSDGSTNCLTFSNVLYAPQMFVSVLSYSVLRQKNLWYHGYEHKLLYREQNGVDAEVAYMPEIDWIPTLLLADDELMEAQSLAFAAVTQPVTSKLRNSRLTPTREVSLQEFHHMFGHADIAALRHMVDTTTGLRLKDVTAFSCETCLIGNFHKQYSRRKPTSPATRFLQRVHVDIVGPITPTAEDGAKYWIIYTDEYTRYQWIDVTDSKCSFTGRFLSFVSSAEAFYGCKIAIIHIDNDTVIVNRETCEVLRQQGTMFELSTSYGQYQNGVAESSNRLTEYRCRNMTIAAPHIPDSMWPYASRYAIELLNHTPSQVLDGKTPQQLRLESMGVADPIPNLHSFRSYGETGYVHREQRQKGAKFDGRAVPMQFISREGSRIYLMWDP
jgi:hypothetical protein